MGRPRRFAGGIERAFDLAAGFECARGRATREDDQQHDGRSPGQTVRPAAVMSRSSAPPSNSTVTRCRVLAGRVPSTYCCACASTPASAGSLAASRAPVARTSTARKRGLGLHRRDPVCEDTLASYTRTWRDGPSVHRARMQAAPRR